MSPPRIGLREAQSHFSPGEPIRGAVDWALDQAPTSAELRLGWYTMGKGTEDFAIVETQQLANPQATDLRQFTFTAPLEPYSFSGKLISLLWAVEVVLEPGEIFERHGIVIAPGGREVILPVLDPKAKRKGS